MAFWRSVDGSDISADEAFGAWAPHARDVLETVAAHYGATLPPDVVAQQVQERAGVQTNLVLHNWLDRVLAEVGDDLDALVVDPRTQNVGPRYGAVPGRWFNSPKDREEAATVARFVAYQRFCESMPLNAEVGAAPVPVDTAPARTTRRSTGTRAAAASAARASGAGTASARARTPKRPAKPEPAPPAICPSCFLQLPATGICNNCE